MCVYSVCKLAVRISLAQITALVLAQLCHHGGARPKRLPQCAFCHEPLSASPGAVPGTVALRDYGCNARGYHDGHNNNVLGWGGVFIFNFKLYKCIHTLVRLQHVCMCEILYVYSFV